MTWLSHVYTFAATKSSDTTLSFMNLFFLFWICLIPFALSVLTEWPNLFYSIALLSIVLIMMGIALLILWMYITYSRKFIHGESNFPSQFMWIVTMRYLFSPICWTLALAIGLINFWAAIAVVLVVPTLAVLAAMGLDVFKWLVNAIYWCGRKVFGDERKPKTLPPPKLPLVENPNYGSIQHNPNKKKEV